MYEFYECTRCFGEFLVFDQTPINCPYCFGVGHLKRGAMYTNLAECMDERSYKKRKGRVVSR